MFSTYFGLLVLIGIFCFLEDIEEVFSLSSKSISGWDNGI
jgi:hypothetical protein